ncbi:DUF6920 family protein [Lusitaniella coriacea]|uniref:DUF6920 family protein n=1 Tax=Lusitaniella coriacea TaxID=1983105 RepID=UPI003CF9A6D2
MPKAISLNTLWEFAISQDRVFSATERTDLPQLAQNYLRRAIAPGTKLASAVRLRMHGEIKLQRWLPFTAEQVICWHRGMIWQAATRMNGLPIWGADRFVDGVGAMRWKLLGLFPVMTASGSDITRSAAGRLQAEVLWLPSTLCRDDVSWTEIDPSQLRANFATQGHPAELTLTFDDTARLQSIQLPRWGNPEGAAFHFVNFGGIVEEEKTFSGYRIPSRLRVGWYFGSARFPSEGEFFRVAIDDAIYH